MHDLRDEKPVIHGGTKLQIAIVRRLGRILRDARRLSESDKKYAPNRFTQAACIGDAYVQGLERRKLIFQGGCVAVDKVYTGEGFVEYAMHMRYTLSDKRGAEWCHVLVRLTRYNIIGGTAEVY